MNWLHRLFRRAAPITESECLNEGIALATDWDGDLHGPFGAELRRKQGHALREEELLHVETTCKEAVQDAYAMVLSAVRAGLNDGVESSFRHEFLQRYPWATDASIGRLYRQALYLATKTGYPR